MADVATHKWRDSRQKRSSKGGGDENDKVGVHAKAPPDREGRGMQHSAARASALSSLTPPRDATCTRRRGAPSTRKARTCCQSEWLLARPSTWPSSVVIAQRTKRLAREGGMHHKCGSKQKDAVASRAWLKAALAPPSRHTSAQGVLGEQEQEVRHRWDSEQRGVVHG